MPHKLFDDILATNPTDVEIKELYEDLRHVFDSPFDELINEAVSNRGCVYLEICQPVAN